MKLLGSFLALKTVEGLECYSCYGVRGADGKGYGVSDESCFDEVSEIRHKIECEAGVNYCVDDFEVDWYTDGEQLATIRRGCGGETKPEDSCWERETDDKKYRWKDCQQSCDKNMCNNDLSVGEKIVEDKIKDLSCFQCKWREEDDGSVQGQQECLEDGKGPTAACPNYQNAGCYAATSHHYLGNTADSLKRHVYKGCSAWADRAVPLSYTYVLEGQEYMVTKVSCIDKDCNERYYQPEKVYSCHTCSATYDSATNELIYGDPACMHNPDEAPVRACSQDAVGCTTELLTDWFTKGDQTATIRRGCIEQDSPVECNNGASDRIMFKDCYEDCQASRCNNNLEVANKFGGSQDSCYTCFYKEENDGSISGNVNCLNDPGADSKFGKGERKTVECPEWAKEGCYTGAAEHDYNGDWKLEVYKGCSSFKLDDLKTYEDTLEDGYTYSVTKNFCSGTNCNEEHVTPEHPGQGGSSAAKIATSVFASIITVLNL